MMYLKKEENIEFDICKIYQDLIFSSFFLIICY